jgi:CubicO group peptidase (beta-lactamase class C family)
MPPRARTAEQIANHVAASGVAPDVATGWAARRSAGEWARETGGATSLYFDLASVTKPMLAVATLASGIDLATPIGALVEETRGTPSEHVPLELFLAHRAGLEAHRALYEPATRGEAVSYSGALVDAAGSRRAECEGAPPVEGFAPVYSDMGYLLAGEALARYVGARDAGDAIRALVLVPLRIDTDVGTARQLEAEGIDLSSRSAPTELAPWRGGLVVGRVHDENAWILSGDGGSGHAGMFGTIGGLLSFAAAVLDAHDGLPTPFGRPLDIGRLARERPGGTLRAGFDGKSVEGSSAGKHLGRRSYGHLGFTGTSVWIDPDAKVVVSLLTNRVNPTRESTAIRAARPETHDALFERAVSSNS